MDKLTQYRQYLRDLLDEYSQNRPSYGQVEVEQIIDSIHDHYQLMTVGWDDYQRIHWLLISYRHQGRKNLDSARWDRRRDRESVGCARSSKNRYRSGLSRSLPPSIH